MTLLGTPMTSPLHMLTCACIHNNKIPPSNTTSLPSSFKIMTRSSLPLSFSKPLSTVLSMQDMLVNAMRVQPHVEDHNQQLSSATTTFILRLCRAFTRPRNTMDQKFHSSPRNSQLSSETCVYRDAFLPMEIIRTLYRIGASTLVL
jgi:hypothetical protein